MSDNKARLTLELFRKEWFLVPNLMTELRGILSPVIFFFLVCHIHWLITAVVYVIAAVTDLIDGWWARKHNQKTWLGENLDPIVDKLLAAAVLFGLCIAHPVFWVIVPAGIITVREVAVAILVEVSRQRNNPLSVTWGGKVKTVFQGIAFFLMMLPLDGFWLIPVWSAIVVAVVLTITSGIGYFKRAYVIGVL